MRRRTILISLGLALLLILVSSSVCLAGNYYVYSCSYYGNVAPAFHPVTNADHLTPADACMQPSPAGGDRTLELNNPGSRAPVLNGHGAAWVANTPSPAITIIGAYTPTNTVLADCTLTSDGFTAGYFWDGGFQSINYVNSCNRSAGYGLADGISRSFSPGSSQFGWSAACSLKGSCWTQSSANAVVGVQGIRLTAEEDTGPSITPTGSDNLWYQGGRYVRGGGWPVSFLATDPSGVCGTLAVADGGPGAVDVTSDPNVDTSSFTQCWASDQATGTINTADYPDGPLTLTLWATNAASVVSAPTTTLQVDNAPMTLSLAAVNDPDVNVWVNHSVTVVAHASAGPSGVGGINCAAGGEPAPYPDTGITVDGTGTHTVACGAWNRAWDVNGHVGGAPLQVMTVKIDETPPSISFEPQAASDPTALTVDTADNQSGLAGGQIAMRPSAGGPWTQLPTRFDGQHLLSGFDDAGLTGPYDFQATSCDRAGNCATTTQRLTLPVRLASRASVGFLNTPTRGARRNTSRRQCTRSRALRHRHPPHLKICRPARPTLKPSEQVPFGRAATVTGALITAQGTPVSGARIRIFTAPVDGFKRFAEQGAVTTDASGVWSARVSPGPSRIIRAVYDGSPTMLPSSAEAKEAVPARIRITSVSPRHVAWGGTVRLTGWLQGGYLPPPPAGELVRLRLGYGRAYTTYGVKIDVTGNGRFTTTYTFGLGPSWLVRRIWFQVQALPQDDYPYRAPSDSQRVSVTVGGRTNQRGKH